MCPNQQAFRRDECLRIKISLFENTQPRWVLSKIHKYTFYSAHLIHAADLNLELRKCKGIEHLMWKAYLNFIANVFISNGVWPEWSVKKVLPPNKNGLIKINKTKKTPRNTISENPLLAVSIFFLVGSFDTFRVWSLFARHHLLPVSWSSGRKDEISPALNCAISRIVLIGTQTNQSEVVIVERRGREKTK